MKRFLIFILSIVIFLGIHAIKKINIPTLKSSAENTAHQLLQVGDDMMEKTYDMYCTMSGLKDSHGNLLRYWNGWPVKEGEFPVCVRWPR